MDAGIRWDGGIEDRNDLFMAFPMIEYYVFWIDRVSVQKNSSMGKVYVNGIVPYSLAGAVSEMIQGNERLISFFGFLQLDISVDGPADHLGH